MRTSLRPMSPSQTPNSAVNNFSLPPRNFILTHQMEEDVISPGPAPDLVPVEVVMDEGRIWNCKELMDILLNGEINGEIVTVDPLLPLYVIPDVFR